MGPDSADDEWDADELSDEEWRFFVAQGLSAELADPREDAYEIEAPTAAREIGL